MFPRLVALTPQWLVLDKPPGWLTIPARNADSGEVLLDWAKQRHGELWIVHRIDRGTSGLVVFARSAEAHRTANLWFQQKEVRKSYDCLAIGSPPAPVFRISRPIEGARSVTQVEVKESFHEGFLARVTPLTGKRHQIRLHLSQESCPLWGDTQYGGPERVKLGTTELSVPRVALHAARIELPSKEVFEASWPEDFSSWVDQLRELGTKEGKSG